MEVRGGSGARLQRHGRGWFAVAFLHGASCRVLKHVCASGSLLDDGSLVNVIFAEACPAAESLANPPWGILGDPVTNFRNRRNPPSSWLRKNCRMFSGVLEFFQLPLLKSIFSITVSAVIVWGPQRSTIKSWGLKR